jgi:uncharacterized Zn finger protein (UPF0148 family)
MPIDARHCLTCDRLMHTRADGALVCANCGDEAEPRPVPRAEPRTWKAWLDEAFGRSWHVMFSETVQPERNE